VADTPIRDRKTQATRARITDAALGLFVSRGYEETTIDQIAEAAGVNRRTIFRHFATKGAILFDHLAIKRDFAVHRLEERPSSEPPLISLYAVLRELCERGYERPLLNQIRLVLAMEPRPERDQWSLGLRAFGANLVTVLYDRAGDRYSLDDIVALTEMVEGWFVTAVRLYFKHGKRSLIKYFDEVVAACAQSISQDLTAVLGLDPVRATSTTDSP
jgi:AcrR family transcriptional regulator